MWIEWEQPGLCPSAKRPGVSITPFHVVKSSCEARGNFGSVSKLTSVQPLQTSGVEATSSTPLLESRSWGLWGLRDTDVTHAARQQPQGLGDGLIITTLLWHLKRPLGSKDDYISLLYYSSQ